MTRRLLQALLALLGVVAITTTLVTIIGGPETIPGGGSVDESVDSELRFNATFWGALGCVALWLVPRVEGQTFALRALAGAMFAGGTARGISLLSVGAPQPALIVLLSLELIMPLLFVALQSRIATPES